VIQGNYNQTAVQFANLQHTYFSRKPADWYVLLVPCGQGVRNALGVEYCVRDQAFAKDHAGRRRLIDAQHGG
jgi:hypothetical protein